MIGHLKLATCQWAPTTDRILPAHGDDDDNSCYYLLYLPLLPLLLLLLLLPPLRNLLPCREPPRKRYMAIMQSPLVLAKRAPLCGACAGAFADECLGRCSTHFGVGRTPRNVCRDQMLRARKFICILPPVDFCHSLEENNGPDLGLHLR